MYISFQFSTAKINLTLTTLVCKTDHLVVKRRHQSLICGDMSHIKTYKKEAEGKRSRRSAVEKLRWTWYRGHEGKPWERATVDPEVWSQMVMDYMSIQLHHTVPGAWGHCACIWEKSSAPESNGGFTTVEPASHNTVTGTFVLKGQFT